MVSHIEISTTVKDKKTGVIIQSRLLLPKASVSVIKREGEAPILFLESRNGNAEQIIPDQSYDHIRAALAGNDFAPLDPKALQELRLKQREEKALRSNISFKRDANTFTFSSTDGQMHLGECAMLHDETCACNCRRED